MNVPPNPRLQRTRAALLLKSVLGERSSSGGDRRAPLSRQPLGAAVQYGANVWRPTSASPRLPAAQPSAASTLAGPVGKSSSGPVKLRESEAYRSRNAGVARHEPRA
jgi:hypothetical protein